MKDDHDDVPEKGKGLYIFRPRRPVPDLPSEEQETSAEPFQNDDVGNRTGRTAKKAEKNQTSKGQTLRLNMNAWRQLRHLSIEEDATGHDLLIEALNDLFRKYKKPPVA